MRDLLNKHLPALTVNFIAGIVLYHYLPHFAGFSFGIAAWCAADLFRAWPYCDNKFGDGHRCTRANWHPGNHCCGSDNFRWHRSMGRKDLF